MHRLLLFISCLAFFSCGKQAKESKENSENNKETVIEALPIQRQATMILDTTLARKLSKEEMTSIFTDKRQIQLGISNQVYQAYTYKDESGEYYLLLTDYMKAVTDEKDTLYGNVYGLNLTKRNNQFKKRSTIKGEIDDAWETSIGFWNQYSQLTDIDNDGLVDPLIVYGTTTQSMYKDGKVRIIVYNKKKRVTIKHQNSEISDGRLTRIHKNFYNFPMQIQNTVIEKMKLMEKNGHAVFAEGWEDAMKNKATRLEKN